jgi:hypothetical protein
MDKASIPIALFAMIGFTSWVVINSIRRFLIARVHANISARLLDRFNTAESLMAYGETAPGRQFMAALIEESADRTSPYRSILTGVQAGIIFTVFGLMLLLLHHLGICPADEAIVFGAVPVTLGIGFLLAAAATYVLSQKFGLLTQKASL